MQKMLMGVLLAVVAMNAMSQDRVFLSKDEVQKLADGKKWNHQRKADGNEVQWVLNSGGGLYARNLTASGTDSGSWTVNDSAQLCVKWRRQSQDRCVAILKDGDHYKMVDSADLAGEYAQLRVE